MKQDTVMEDELQYFAHNFKKEELVDLNQNIKRTKFEILRFKMQEDYKISELKELFSEWQKLRRIIQTVKEKNIIYRFYDELSIKIIIK